MVAPLAEGDWASSVPTVVTPVPDEPIRHRLAVESYIRVTLDPAARL